MPLARVDLESLLRTRRLARTLTTTLPPPEPRDEAACAPSGVPSLDAPLGGGFPRGQLSEVVGPRSSGRTSIMLQTAVAATGRGELVALVDALDRKSTRLNSSHLGISYAVFCLKKKKQKN